MPLTTLNKIVAQFLVGGVVLVLALVVHWAQFKPMLFGSGNASPGAETGFWVVAGVLIVPLAALLGGIVEGLSDVTLRRILKKTRKWRWLAWALARQDACDGLQRWRDQLQKSLRRSRSFHWVVNPDLNPRKEPEWFVHSASAGTFLLSAREDEFRWLVEEYATFVLTSNLAFVLICGVLYVPTATLAADAGIWWPVSLPFNAKVAGFLALLGFWALSSLAVGKYLYAHEMGERRWCLSLDAAVSQGSHPVVEQQSA